jgi:hypothetical protein
VVIVKRDIVEDKVKNFKISNYERTEDRNQYEFLSPFYLPRLVNKGVTTSNPNDP